jgi:hypothetical protein
VPASTKPTTSKGALQLVRNRAGKLQVKRHAKTTKAGPAELTEALAWAYEFKDVSLRDLAEASGRSYGCVHRWLTNSGVQLRGRGGTRRKPVNN